MSNPLSNKPACRPSPRIMPEHVEPAIDHLLAENRRRIGELLDNTPAIPRLGQRWTDREWEDRLGRIWSPVSHMNSVINSEALRAAYNACLPKLSDYGTEMGKRETVRGLPGGGGDPGVLDDGQRKVLDNELRDFHLSGVDLPADKKLRFRAISQELSSLTSKIFGERARRNEPGQTGRRCRRAVRAATVGDRPGAPDRAEQRADRLAADADYPSFHPVLTCR